MSNPNTAHVISPSLAKALASNSVSTSALPSEEALQSLISSALQAQASLGLAYHNEVHVRGVVARCTELAQHAQLPAEERFVLLVSAAFHDHGHAGATYRQMVSSIERPDLSNEEYAALHADLVLEGIVSPQVRLAVQGAILATSFAQSDPAALPRPDIYRPYHPYCRVEKLLAFADVSNLLSGIEPFGEDNFKVHRESSAPLPESFDDFLQGVLKFIDYVRERLAEIADYLSPEVMGQFAGRIEEVADYVRALSLSSARTAHPWAHSFAALLRENKFIKGA